MNKYLLFGNPNVGKTSVFNQLTDSNESVSNFEGVTIARKSAVIRGNKGELTDIPGVYSINSFSVAEDVSQKALIQEACDGIIDVLNINDLKRNLYLLIDLLETGKPVNAIFNIEDLFTGEINIEAISSKLGINILVANHNNYKETLEQVAEFTENRFALDYGLEVETAIEVLIANLKGDTNGLDKKFFAIQFLQGDNHLLNYFDNQELVLKTKLDLQNDIVGKDLARSISGHIFNVRRTFINELLAGNYTPKKEIDQMPFMNNVFDKYALHRVWGFFIFAFVMFLVFFVSVQGGFMQDIVDGAIGSFAEMIEGLLASLGAGDILISFMIDGAIAGVGGVLVFLPQIIILFAMLTVFESIGYFARVNALFENLFNKIGISSSSMIPFISGFGCNVIGIMGTRTIPSEKKRIATILASPFISCSARLPVYLIFVEIFFETSQTAVLLFLYFLGIFVAIAVAFVIDKIIYQDHDIQTILPLPKYKKVQAKYFLRITWVKVKSFIVKAGTLIFIGSLGLWIISSLGPNGYTTNIAESFVGLLADKLSWILNPLGFGTVQAFSALIVSFLAKELAVSGLIVMYGANGIDALAPILQTEFTPAAALSFMVFVLLYIPCLATLGAIYSETKKIKYVAYSVGISLTIGYILAFITYHIGLLIF
ncbi:ferrous iron transport protein B [Mollicutes bacterium LVI A0039]|nr:ferrous iron transport protein B [Mollicutes bacterium LVI A0039]